MTRIQADDSINRLIPEKELLATVVEMAEAHCGLVHHTLDVGPRPCPNCGAKVGQHAKRIGPGFPDLVIALPPTLYLWELKSQLGRVSPDQQVWADTLGRCTKIQSGIYRPSDLDTMQKLLATLHEL